MESCAARDASAQCNLVCEFEIPANGDAARNGADLHRKIVNAFVDIESSGVAFHGRTQRKDDLTDFIVPGDPGY